MESSLLYIQYLPLQAQQQLQKSIFAPMTMIISILPIFNYGLGLCVQIDTRVLNRQYLSLQAQQQSKTHFFPKPSVMIFILRILLAVNVGSQFCYLIYPWSHLLTLQFYQFYHYPFSIYKISNMQTYLIQEIPPLIVSL